MIRLEKVRADFRAEFTLGAGPPARDGCRHDGVFVLSPRLTNVTRTAPAPSRNYGEVFTRRWVVEVLLDLCGYRTDRDLGALHLVEPSCGSGAFLGPVVERLIKSVIAHGRDLATLGDAIRAYDLRADHVEVSRALSWSSHRSRC